MTYQELCDKWSRNINAEYIMPTLYELSRDNLIINKKDLICDKGKMTFVSNGDIYRIKVKKIIND